MISARNMGTRGAARSGIRAVFGRRWGQIDSIRIDLICAFGYDTRSAYNNKAKRRLRVACAPASEEREHRLETADYYRQKAAQCRRLADALVNQDDPVVAALLVLAVEFEAKSVALAAA